MNTGDVVSRTPWWARVVVALAGLMVLVLLLGGLHLLPGLPNPFAERTNDRSGPVLLKSIQDMSRYEGASGNFEVVVDLQKDAKYLPDIVHGERTLYVGAGSVDAYVDLGSLKSGAVTVSDDRTSAAIRLPHAALERTSLDPEHSYVVSQKRGLFDRVGDFFGSDTGNAQKLSILAAQKIQDAAKKTELTTRAEANTRSMLQGMLTSLGFTRISISFGPPPATPTQHPSTASPSS
ncbi:DUF4230 domain-containing protein [Streptomyces sp. NPDC021020]|uniref:DUF4230 domain-containing protein n=1 Tax=Streptomyces sp. NPDC021020 TaxID=3365109 RepID=UPI0037BB94B0